MPAKFWIYQAERFPLAKTLPLLAVFSAASICVSAELSGRALPHWGVFLAAFVIAMTLFFQMRVCDEYKDLDDDRRYRPDRPIPRGLVSLRQIVLLGVVTLPLTGFAAWGTQTIWLLGLVWIWLALMTVEFGVPAWLKTRPVLYLLSHMAIMPLIDLLLTGTEWVRWGTAAPALILFLLLSFVNGCVLEIGRKLWAPEAEIEGVDTYSKLWGVVMASRIWGVCVLLSFGLLVGVGIATGTALISGVIGLVGLTVCFWRLRQYQGKPTPKSQDQMDSVAGLWVFMCYATAGFVPLISKAFM